MYHVLRYIYSESHVLHGLETSIGNSTNTVTIKKVILRLIKSLILDYDCYVLVE